MQISSSFTYEVVPFTSDIRNIYGSHIHVYEVCLDCNETISFSTIHSASYRQQTGTLWLSISYEFLGPAIPWAMNYHISLSPAKLDFEIFDYNLGKNTKTSSPIRFSVHPGTYYLHIRNLQNSDNQYEFRVN